ncbi:hypothetical protein [Pseudomonas sp. OV226]|jgi:hypothetical protein|uniref:hypothetical protein n=1 Tax=Pseudomonas sp. OV226 TaxID=2135588 RepID=UPI000D6A9BDD|nr:hypothetical protein [Pseudomonas sp. OV226]PWK43872.1 hypothetical protein C7534_103253 [Pseudomonas sp. OV226]
MTLSQRIVALFAVAVALGGCTGNPVYTAKEHFPSDRGLTNDRMSRAIVTALIERQWVVQSARPGMIKAAVTVRDKHHAEIDIPYTSNSFEIDYRDSRGLDYQDGRIHGTYNRWITYLRDDVIQQLAADPDRDQLVALQNAYEPTFQNFREGVKRATEIGLLDGSVKFYLAGEALPANVSKLNTVSSSRITHNEEVSDEDACFWALQSTLATLQSKAKKAGANAVINIAGAGKRDLSSDSGSYQCLPKVQVSGVVLRGELVRIE